MAETATALLAGPMVVRHVEIERHILQMGCLGKVFAMYRFF
jgi:hypothetical protein